MYYMSDLHKYVCMSLCPSHFSTYKLASLFYKYV
uniref:Uncharacterized protein n=1 Tax=Anguilla anguilla TaxID=7936 RepID=A0A0E9WIY0_ANGAN